MKIFLVLAFTACLSGCLERIGQIDRNLKPYGAHWVKDGMTVESRIIDWLECGGGANLSDGYERTSGITNKEYFDGLNSRRNQIRNCMDSKGYNWIEKCDTRCL